MKFRHVLPLVNLSVIVSLLACGGGSSSKSTTTPPAEAIAATSGGGQSAVASKTFGSPLVATVTQGGVGVSGIAVTFTAPATGASGKFATSGTAMETDTTNASGVATSSAFTANATTGAYMVSATATGATGTANFSLTNTAAPLSLVIAATNGGGQSVVASKTFGSPLVATVTQGGVGVSGIAVTFTAPATGASGKFATGGTATETDTTNANGVATSSAFTANATTGSYTVSATATGATGTANFSLTNLAAAILTPGNYVFSLSGIDSNFFSLYVSYFVSGVFTVGPDGVTITGGEQDFVDCLGSLPVTGLPDSLTGTVSPSNDGTGNLVITLNTGDPYIGPGASNIPTGTGTETLVATLVSNSKAVVAGYDTWATSSGTLELQNSTAAAATPSAGYAFMLDGIDSSGLPLAMGGVINVDGPGTISGAGSIFDANDNASIYQGETFASSMISAPDSLGRVVFTLNPSTDFPQIILVGYIVDATHIRLVETADSFYGATGGTALSQGANTGMFSSISGNSYVVGLAGVDEIGEFQAAGLLTAGPTAVSGVVNFNDLSGTGVQAPDPVTEGTSTYTLDPTGRVTIPGMTDGTTTGANFNLQLYLDGNGNALALTLDSTDVISGLGYQQTGGGSFTAGSFKGSYVIDAVGNDVTYENPLNAIGTVNADGVGSFAGAVDLNWLNGSSWLLAQSPDLPVSGTFTAAVQACPACAASGVFTGTITGLDVTTATNDAFTYYMIDTTRAVAIETDSNQLTLGYFQLQQ